MPRLTRQRKNTPELLLENLAETKGWTTTKRGWPDFMCFSKSTGEMIAIEVKPMLPSGRLQLLKRAQAKCMDFLTKHGIRCFVSDGITLEKYQRDKHASEMLRRAHRLRHNATP
jgi:hypothetical protein